MRIFDPLNNKKNDKITWKKNRLIYMKYISVRQKYKKKLMTSESEDIRYIFSHWKFFSVLSGGKKSSELKQKEFRKMGIIRKRNVKTTRYCALPWLGWCVQSGLFCWKKNLYFSIGKNMYIGRMNFEKLCCFWNSFFSWEYSVSHSNSNCLLKNMLLLIDIFCFFHVTSILYVY